VYANFLSSGIVHRLKVPIQRCFVVVDHGKNTAKDPTVRIAHSNGDNFVVNAGHNGKIDLPE
jgi:hypothetical protein